MGTFIDITGNVFGRLKVVKFSHIHKKHTYWVCICVCGKYKTIDGSVLKCGASKSCGCLNREKISERSMTHGDTVGGHSAEYMTWSRMKARIFNKNTHNYENYGGRGITICDRWVNSFSNFLKDMGRRPTSKHSLDRFPNVNGNYCKENCRWATGKEQAGNKRNNRWLEYRGKKMILADWSLHLKTAPINIRLLMKTKSFEDVVEFYNNKNN